jgi:2-polyprenyl-6-methoxyphenol hydroxylase-like FAD-dependent oxidoreductase
METARDKNALLTFIFITSPFDFSLFFSLPSSFSEVDITARGMNALALLGLGWRPEDDAAGAPPHALRRRLLPFWGHTRWDDAAAAAGAAAAGGGASADGPRGPGDVNPPGLLGTRDDIVLGLLEHLEEDVNLRNMINVHHGVCLQGLNLSTGELTVAASTKAAIKVEPNAAADGAAETGAAEATASEAARAACALGGFDLVVAADGKGSVARGLAAGQDPGLVVTPSEGRDGEEVRAREA